VILSSIAFALADTVSVDLLHNPIRELGLRLTNHSIVHKRVCTSLPLSIGRLTLASGVASSINLKTAKTLSHIARGRRSDELID